MYCARALQSLKIRIIEVRAFLPPNKSRARSSSQHSDTTGCPLYRCCKFEINLRLFAIWLVTMKYITALKSPNSTFGLPCYLHEKRKLCHSSQHFEAIRCLFDLHKKFQIKKKIGEGPSWLSFPGPAYFVTFILAYWLLFLLNLFYLKALQCRALMVHCTSGQNYTYMNAILVSRYKMIN